jgi:hypothetical protein
MGSIPTGSDRRQANRMWDGRGNTAPPLSSTLRDRCIYTQPTPSPLHRAPRDHRQQKRRADMDNDMENGAIGGRWRRWRQEGGVTYLNREERERGGDMVAWGERSVFLISQDTPKPSHTLPTSRAFKWLHSLTPACLPRGRSASPGLGRKTGRYRCFQRKPK